MTTLIPLGRWRHLAWVGSLVAPLLGFGWHAKAVSPPAPQGKQIPMVIQGMLNEAAARTDASFRVQRQGEGAYFQNSEHGLSARYYNGTFEVSHGGHTWGFALRSWGRGERRESVLAGDGQGTANRVEAGRGPGITEWFVNGPLGLQHGITLEQPPRCDLIDWRHRDAATEEKCDRRAPVQLEFETQGTLRAVVLPGGRDLSLRDSLGREQIRYRGLTAYDADGKELFAAIVAQGPQLKLVVDDSTARYPVIIDPLIESGKLTVASPQQNLMLGKSVAIDGDVIVVGAPFLGKVFVYTRLLPAGRV